MAPSIRGHNSIGRLRTHNRIFPLLEFPYGRGRFATGVNVGNCFIFCYFR
jgi:hypothetical protein